VELAAASQSKGRPVTEAEWNRCDDPQAMLAFLRDSGRASDRKLRLFRVACCRRIWHILPEPACREAVEVAERFAEGTAPHAELAGLRDRVAAVYQELARARYEAEFSVYPYADRTSSTASLLDVACAVLYAASSEADAFDIPLLQRLPWTYSRGIDDGCGLKAAHAAARTAEVETYSVSRQWNIRDLCAVHNGAERSERAEQAILLRDLFGPLPFRPVAVEDGRLAWNGGTVRRLAEAAYQERSRPGGTLDNARLGVLADALEEAGCRDGQLLDHLRGPGPHARGCWVVDAVLGKS
jgi:hypothetical protein